MTACTERQARDLRTEGAGEGQKSMRKVGTA